MNIFLLLYVISFIFLFVDIIVRIYFIYSLFKNVNKAIREKWISKKARLIDARLRSKNFLGFFIPVNNDYFFAIFKKNKRYFGVKKIGLYPSSNFHSRVILKNIIDDKKVTIWHHPEYPHINSLIPPDKHKYSSYIIRIIFDLFLIYLIGMYLYGNA